MRDNLPGDSKMDVAAIMHEARARVAKEQGVSYSFNKADQKTLSGRLISIRSLLDEAFALNKERVHWPSRFSKWPLHSTNFLTRLILRVYNALFYDQRQINNALFKSNKQLLTALEALLQQQSHAQSDAPSASPTKTE